MVSAESNSPTAMVTASSPPAVDEVEIIDTVTPAKKKRNLPGMPDPTAEVIALSPKSLLATNRFVCEICNKGFQRDQNLQLHRRGHNLPWKLRQRTSNEIRKRVYVCPEPSCVHHNPARALGDLTGIKKHFSRKHCEKKWKCERCSKKYAVQSDWKAHMKTCGTREYKCDCGTLFSRRDSFITHRAFCDALAFASSDTNVIAAAAVATAVVASSPLATVPVSPGLSIQSSEPPDIPMGPPPLTPAATSLTSAVASTVNKNSPTNGGGASFFAGVFSSSPPTVTSAPPNPPHQLTTGVNRSDGGNDPSTTAIEPTSLSLSTSLFLSCRASASSGSTSASSIFQDHTPHYSLSPQPAAMSATALLQKAAQMGVTSSNASSLLRASGLSLSQSPGPAISMTAGLGLGFGNEPTTRDLLGLGMGGGGGGGGGVSGNGISALFTSFDGCDVETASPYGGGGSNGL
ncbi:protein indeterminate-domain 1-like [Cucumis melo var. makuwa]|uniref:Protein indeterminate-domain 1-like n=1 Tax=Cucumis melo var. makuwa TaxID=1194695 RepID=A0A5A7VIF0_CUCMM|nr:protein indeterminate-domain 1-like [Cucumis melo var. makuwa]